MFTETLRRHQNFSPMGLFDFFSKPKQNSKHHHAFAHYALRYVAYSDPLGTFAVLGTDDRVRFLDSLIAELDTKMEGEGRRNFSGKDIEFFGNSIDGRPCAMLKMPPTTNPAEAYFVAIVSRFTVKEIETKSEELSMTGLIDYYTLERPVMISEDYQSVFCGWTEDDTHLNFGGGPAPTIKNFFALLKGQRPCG